MLSISLVLIGTLVTSGGSILDKKFDTSSVEVSNFFFFAAQSEIIELRAT